MELYHNPFSGLWLIAPNTQQNAYNQYCQGPGSGKKDPDEKPFPRRVDFWFTGLSLAAWHGLKPIGLNKNSTFHFIDGGILDNPSWRVQAVMLVAIATEDNVEIVEKPSRMMHIANGLAAAGVPRVVEMLENGNQEPIWNLSDSLLELF